jgi:hypothetical protein
MHLDYNEIIKFEQIGIPVILEYLAGDFISLNALEDRHEIYDIQVLRRDPVLRWDNKIRLDFWLVFSSPRFF